MKAILIFDSLNDLLFSKWDDSFILRMKCFSEQDNEGISDCHIVSQLLSPIITSQRVMAAQFGNTYSSMQCKDNTTIVFDEWLDHVFMIISEDTVDDSLRELLDCKTFVQHICGQNINLLQSPVYQDWLSVLLDNRTKGDSIPGASGMIGESGATAAALNALKTESKEIKCSPHQHYHLILYVGDKILALYSSRGSEDLTSPDLILMSIQCIAAQEYWKSTESLSKNGANIVRLPWLSEENSAIVNICAGPANSPCAPYSMHIAEVAPRITFVILVDMDIREVGIAAHMSIQILSNLRRLLLQRNLELLPPTLDSLEAAFKKTTDALRKNKSNSNICTRLTSRMLELKKACGTTTPITPETAAAAARTALDSVLEQLKPDIPSVRMTRPLQELRTTLAPYVEFLRVKAMRYFSMESFYMSNKVNKVENLLQKMWKWLNANDPRNNRNLFVGHLAFIDLTMFARDLNWSVFEQIISLNVGGFVSTSSGVVETDASSSLTLHKYVEEFPGLVHFVFVDRTAGRFIAPDMADCADMLLPETVRGIMSRALSVVHEGYSAATWRRGALHACSVLWWERKGTGVRPSRVPHPAAVRALPPPGDILASFYRQLLEQAFPSETQGVSIKELICVHLGLLPASTAVQQARRLAHTVQELAGDNPTIAADLL